MIGTIDYTARQAATKRALLVLIIIAGNINNRQTSELDEGLKSGKVALLMNKS
jgi:hypothetical protein